MPITVYRHPNPELRSYLTPVEISAFRVEHFIRPLDKSSEMKLDALGKIGSQVVKEIMTIPGVEEIRIKPKEIRMKKDPASSWDHIEDRVMKILERAYKRTQIRIVKR